MAWDALAGMYKQKDEDKQGTDALKTTYTPGSAQTSAGSVATNKGDYSSFYGQGGDAGAPVSAGFVNYGTMYDLNKDAAAKQADSVQSKAAGKAADASGALAGARNAFNQQATQGSGVGVAGGNHPTRIGEYAETGPGARRNTGGGATGPSGGGGQEPLANKGSATAHLVPNWGPPTAVDADPVSVNPSGSIGITGGSLDQGVAATEKANADAAAAAAVAATKNRGAQSPYASLLGATGTGALLEGGVGDPRQNQNVVSELDAKSGAGQQYTGPDSLKGSMGDDAYAALAEQLRKAEAGTQQLTNAGGIATALGYGPADATGNSALDAGLTQTAGQGQFRALADRYKGLSNLLPQAQADSERAAAGGKLDAAGNAKGWQDLLDQQKAAASGGESHKNNSQHLGGLDTGTSRANKITSGGYGYTASDMDDALNSGVLSDEDVQYLNGENIEDVPLMGGVAGAIGNAGRGSDSASVMANILEKLRRWKESKGKK